MIITWRDSTSDFFQVRSGDPEDQLNQLLGQILSSGGWKLGRCIPSECTDEDAGQVWVRHQYQHWLSPFSGAVELCGADDRGRRGPCRLVTLWLCRHELPHCRRRGEDSSLHWAARQNGFWAQSLLLRSVLRLKIGEWWASLLSLLDWSSSARWWTWPWTSSTSTTSSRRASSRSSRASPSTPTPSSSSTVLNRELPVL